MYQSSQRRVHFLPNASYPVSKVSGNGNLFPTYRVRKGHIGLGHPTPLGGRSVVVIQRIRRLARVTFNLVLRISMG